jgi:ABC-type Mn2+/Zn2+ transport system permease subunit
LTLEDFMILRKRIRPHAVLTFGLIALSLANVGSYLVQRKLDVPVDVADGISGFLMGVAISTMLLGIWMNRRQPRGNG